MFKCHQKRKFAKTQFSAPDNDNLRVLYHACPVENSLNPLKKISHHRRSSLAPCCCRCWLPRDRSWRCVLSWMSRGRDAAAASASHRGPSGYSSDDGIGLQHLLFPISDPVVLTYWISDRCIPNVRPIFIMRRWKSRLLIWHRQEQFAAPLVSVVWVFSLIYRGIYANWTPGSTQLLIMLQLLLRKHILMHINSHSALCLSGFTLQNKTRVGASALFARNAQSPRPVTAWKRGTGTRWAPGFLFWICWQTTICSTSSHLPAPGSTESLRNHSSHARLMW